MDYLKRAKMNVEMMNDAYNEKYKGKMRVRHEEEIVNEKVVGLIVFFEAPVNEKILVTSFKMTLDVIERERGNIFTSRLLEANHKMRDEIINVALGLK